MAEMSDSSEILGLGGRIHSELVWAKLRTLAEGARLASKELWR